MKFFLDLTKKQLVKSAASNVALDRLVLKRRDSLAVEVAFVARGAVASMPAGTTTTVALKRTFADSNFLALASGTPQTLNLNTVPLEASFSANPASVSALLEIRWSVPGETTRTATLAVEIQNSVILGSEGTPEAIPDGKATQAEATTGTDNTKWMTPLRTAQAIAQLAPPPTWDSVTGKPTEFPPAPHFSSKITDFAAAVALAAPPTTDASLLTSGTLPDARLASTIARSADLTTEQNARIAGDTALGQRIDFLAANLDPAALDSIAEAAASIGSLQTQINGKAATVHTHTASQITDFTSAVVAAAPAPTTPSNSGLSITGTAIATAYNTAIADGVVSVSVGGAPAAPASAWKAKSLVQVLDDILFPTILASVGSAKSLDLAVSGTSGTLEIGTSVSRTLTATFARGTITNGSGSVNANTLVGDATGYTFTGAGISSTAQGGNTLAITAAVVSGSNNWAVTATHAAGTGTYTDNKGVAGTNLDASRGAGSLTDSTSSPAITGVHPYYYLKSASPISASAMVTAIQNGTATKVIAASTGTLSIPYAPSAEYLAVAYPATSTTKTRYHVTALDNGAITVVFSPVATQTVTTALWSQSYRIHTSTGALTNSNATIELRNT